MADHHVPRRDAVHHDAGAAPPGPPDGSDGVARRGGRPRSAKPPVQHLGRRGRPGAPAQRADGVRGVRDPAPLPGDPPEPAHAGPPGLRQAGDAQTFARQRSRALAARGARLRPPGPGAQGHGHGAGRHRPSPPSSRRRPDGAGLREPAGQRDPARARGLVRPGPRRPGRERPRAARPQHGGGRGLGPQPRNPGADLRAVLHAAEGRDRPGPAHRAARARRPWRPGGRGEPRGGRGPLHGAPARATGTEGTRPVAERKILLVDDEEDVRLPLRRLPGRQGLLRARGRRPRGRAGAPAHAVRRRRDRGLLPARRRRPRRPAHPEEPGRFTAGGAPDRPRHHRPRGEGHQGGGGAVPDQARRAARPRDHRPARAREPADAPDDTRGQVLPDPPGGGSLLRGEPRHPQARGGGGAGGGLFPARPDPGRDGNGQGRPGPLAPPELSARGRAVRRPELRGAHARAPGVRALRAREGRVHGGGRRPSPVSWRSRTGAPSSSTRSATWTCRFKPSS